MPRIETYVWTGPGSRIFIGGHSFIRRLVSSWCRGKIAFEMPFHGEAMGQGGMTLPDFLAYIKKRDMSSFHLVFLQLGENDLDQLAVGQITTHMLMITEKLEKQRVRLVKFGQIFPRHNRRLNKKIHKLNTILAKKHKEIFWSHGDVATKEAISDYDHLHLKEARYDDFQASIRLALQG